MTHTLFVYGTLMPGEPSWPLLEPHARNPREVAVPGRLYDTGHGYPGAVFDRAADPVFGWCCEIDEEPLARLDRWEGPDYERVSVTATDGTNAVAWAWRTSLAGCVLISSGRWPIRT